MAALTHTFQLTNGDTRTAIDLTASTSGRANVRRRHREEVILHVGDAQTDGAEPVRTASGNWEWTLDIQFLAAANRNTFHDNYHKFMRLFHWASDSRTYSPVDKVYLDITADSASNWTRYDVKYAYVEDETGMWRHLAWGKSTPTGTMSVVIVTEPRGYGAEETLKNYCWGPSFDVDSNSDGLADFWESMSFVALETFTRDTDYYLVGGYSQKIVTTAAATDEGIQSAWVPAGASADLSARIPVYRSAGDVVTVELYGDVTGSIDTDTTASTVDTEVGEGGATWQIFELTGAADAGGENVQVRVYRDNGVGTAATTFYVDRVYLSVTTATLPTAWSGHYHLENHADNGYELSTNGNFETAGGGGADIWGTWTESVTDGALADEVVFFHDGAHAAKITAGPLKSTMISQEFTVVSGQPYTVEFWAAGDGANAGRYMLYDNDNATGIWPGVPSTGVTAAAYSKFRRSFVAPDGCTSVDIRLRCPDINGGIAYFDDVSILSPSHHNYLDVARIPGDEPPLYRLKSANATWGTEPMYMYLGSTDADPGPATYYYRQYTTSGSADRKYKTTSVEDEWINIAQRTVGTDELRGEYIIAVILSDADTAACSLRGKIIMGSASTGLSTYYYTDTITASAHTNKWIVEFLGPVNLMWPELFESGEITRNAVVDVEAKHAANTANILTDAIYLIPAHGGLSVSAFDAVDADTPTTIIIDAMSAYDGPLTATDSTTIRTLKPPIAGNHPRLRPHDHQRLVFMARQLVSGEYHEELLGGLGELTLTYRPRTSFLLGTT